ncbi:hypothetical protein AAHH67_10660 [Niallia circulans]
MSQSNAEKLQSAISDDLFPTVQHVSDVKQVLEEMKSTAQELREPQIKALLLLKSMGENKYLHPDGNPYKKIVEFIMEGKVYVASPDYYLDAIEALIPKPPKPIIMAEKGAIKK